MDDRRIVVRPWRQRPESGTKHPYVISRMNMRYISGRENAPQACARL